MMAIKFFCNVVCIGIYLKCISAFTLNIEELKSVSYNLDILSIPILKDQNWETDILKMTNKHGQEYICTLPPIQISESDTKKEEELNDPLVDISELLKPMESAPCLIKKISWWSYEFCAGSVIKQYHMEDDKVVGPILILGKYDSEYDWKNNSKSKNKMQKFHMQKYVNGTRCDITGESRQSEVHFHCEEGVGDYIQHVDEPESCRYVMTIATTRVCHHPYLKPNPNQTPHSINCAPALTQEEWDRYHNHKEGGKKSEEDVDLKSSDKAELQNVLSNDNVEEDDISVQLVTFPMSKNKMLSRSQLRYKLKSIMTKYLKEPAEPSLFKEALDAVKTESISTGSNSPVAEDEGVSNSFMDGNDLNEEGKKSSPTDGIIKKYEKGEQELEEEDEAEEFDAKKFYIFRLRMETLMKKLFDTQLEGLVFSFWEKIRPDVPGMLWEFANKKLRLHDGSLLYDLINEAFDRVDDNDEPDDHVFLEIWDRIEPEFGGILRELGRSSQKFSLSYSVLINLYEIMIIAGKYQDSETAVEGMDEAEREKFIENLLNLFNVLDEKESSKAPKNEENEDTDNKDNTQRDSKPGLSGDVRGGDDPGLGVATPEVPSKPLVRIGSTPNPFLRYQDVFGIVDEDDYLDDDWEFDDIVNIEGGRWKKYNKDSDHKQFEDKIKENLRKKGISNIGGKIEVKILTPKYFEEKSPLSSLTPEETDLFHNVIINFLTASAEEIKEKEHHNSLEHNYNFVAIPVGGATASSAGKPDKPDEGTDVSDNEKDKSIDEL